MPKAGDGGESSITSTHPGSKRSPGHPKAATEISHIFPTSAQTRSAGARHLSTEFTGDALPRTHSSPRPGNPLPSCRPVPAKHLRKVAESRIWPDSLRPTLRQLLPLGIFAAAVLKPALPPLLPAPYALRPPLLARFVLAVRLGTRKGIGPRTCHINWEERWESRHWDGHAGGMITVTLRPGVETGLRRRFLSFLPGLRS